MTKLEFLPVLSKMAAAVGKPLSVEAIDVYFDLLGDLPAAVFEAAAKRVVLEHRYASFPSVAQLRAAAVAIMSPEAIDAGEAWEICRKAVTRFTESDSRDGVPREQWNQLVLRSLPPTAGVALRQFGWRRLRDTPGDQLGTAFAQFRGIYDGLTAKEQSQRLMPAALSQQIEALRISHLPTAIAGVITNKIGNPEEAKL